MKIIIDIPDEFYKYAYETGFLCWEWMTLLELTNAIKNGTPLPKGHGRLIDADAITKDVKTLQNSFVINIDNMTGKILGCECLAPTIIERSDTDECNL